MHILQVACGKNFSTRVDPGSFVALRYSSDGLFHDAAGNKDQALSEFRDIFLHCVLLGNARARGLAQQYNNKPSQWVTVQSRATRFFRVAERLLSAGMIEDPNGIAEMVFTVSVTVALVELPLYRPILVEKIRSFF